MLTIYDITAGICRYYHLKIDKVYIVGNGPKRGIQILKLQPKVQKIGKIRLRYVNMGDLLVSLDNCKANVNQKIRKSMDGDAMESYLCNWQKTIKKWGVKFNELRMGKPAYDLFIDDKALNSIYHWNNENFVSNWPNVKN